MQGITPGSDMQTCEAIVARLNERGTTAYLEYPGWINVPLDGDITLAFGDANETWTGDFCTEDGTCLGAFDTKIPVDPIDSPNLIASPEQIASLVECILAQTKRFKITVPEKYARLYQPSEIAASQRVLDEALQDDGFQNLLNGLEVDHFGPTDRDAFTIYLTNGPVSFSTYGWNLYANPSATLVGRRCFRNAESEFVICDAGGLIVYKAKK